jgi:BirA family transcriptional regulator, biotin operon repressor / biotin---[acetyl-CoA-carboxylase] ligase
VTALEGWPDGVRLIRFETVESTNEEALRLAAAGDSGPVWITAREQTKGRGRRGNAWISSPGNLFATLLLKAPHSVAAQLGFAVSLAAADVVASYAAHSRAGLKWPNDVLLDGRKVAGVLLEALGRDALAIGIGINLLHHPEGTETPAISVNAATGRVVSADEALGKLAARFAAWYAIWQSQGFAGLKPHWLMRASGRGGPIRARLAQNEIEGVFEDLDHDGALLLRTVSAGVVRITAAEVFLGEGVH